MEINKNIFKDKKIIVTGGTGSIGSEIVRQLLKFDVAQVRVYSRGEHKHYELRNELSGDSRVRYLIGDIRDKERMDTAFTNADICFHAAALKHVPICEYNPFEVVKTNVIGTQNIIDLALKHNLEKVVAISTDKAVDPVSVLGASKLMMEKLITSANFIIGPSRTKFSSVRFGNVLNSRGSVIPLWKEQIKQGGPVTVTDKNMTRFFMETREAVELVFKAAELMKGRETFVLKMKKINVEDLAKKVINKYSPDKHIPIKFIGSRDGEKLYEKLLTEDDSARVFETEEMFIILPQKSVLVGEDKEINYDCLGIKEVIVKSYRSDEI